MSGFKWKIEADLTTPADGDSIVSYLYASDGTALLHDSGNLQVHLAGQDADITIADGGNSLTVDGTVAATQSGVWNIGSVASITADVNIADGGNSITVDAVDLDIRALDHVTIGDSVRVGDGTEIMLVNADGSINVQSTFGAPDSGFNYEDDDVTTTAAELVATPLASRKRIKVANVGNKMVYVGADGSVTAANGWPLAPNSALEWDLGPSLNLFAIAASGTQDVRIVELA